MEIEFFAYQAQPLFLTYAILAGLTLVSYFGIKFFVKKIIPNKLGFISINPDSSSSFVAFEGDKDNTLERVVKTLAKDKINIYSNLTKMNLSKKGKQLTIEDTNFKISYLVNRRRSRSCILKNGDIIDIGDLTMMVIDPDNDEKNLANEKANENLKISKASGKMLKNTSALIPLDTRRKFFYLTKNLSFIGRSEENDLVVKVMDVSLRHAKIQRIANMYKITDLNSENGTFINGKRINEKYLSDNDLISFESVQFRFSNSGKSA